ncbi:uncharacterized protein LOC111948909 [Oryzias latipes]
MSLTRRAPGRFCQLKEVESGSRGCRCVSRPLHGEGRGHPGQVSCLSQGCVRSYERRTSVCCCYQAQIWGHIFLVSCCASENTPPPLAVTSRRCFTRAKSVSWLPVMITSRTGKTLRLCELNQCHGCQ